jgi:signal transduction histidine kinase
VCVELTYELAVVRLEISDDGEGFAVPPTLTELAQCDSFGLIGVQERVWALGGSLEINSSLGYGTRLNVRLPIP